jgi:2-keto-4-pentenoate hydratase/2-oxohepta-3-ene-1,7-dioic acid hydratase in catechol pathway
MRLASFRVSGSDRVGLLIGDRLVAIEEALGARVDAPADMIALIEKAPAFLEALRAAEGRSDLPGFALEEIEWHPPVRRPSKIVCLALNNRSLDKIKIKAPTDHPAFFLKPMTALVGHRHPVEMRPTFGFTHPEPELAVIIGRRMRDASPEEAFDAVFGYSIMNDITSVGMREEDSFSVRYYRPDPHGGDMIADVAHTTYPGRYKASDGFAPLGPWIVTKDELPDPAALRIRCRMGDRLVADDHTKNYVWDVANALSKVSETMTLLPGDVVSMGTAVGGDQDDARAPDIPGVTRCNINGYDGDVRVEISGIGELINPILKRA